MAKNSNFHLGSVDPLFGASGFSGFRFSGELDSRQRRRQEERDLRIAEKKARATTASTRSTTARGFGSTTSAEGS